MKAHYLGQVVFHVKNLERARDFCRDILMRQVMPTSPSTVEYADRPWLRIDPRSNDHYLYWVMSVLRGYFGCCFASMDCRYCST